MKTIRLLSAIQLLLVLVCSAVALAQDVSETRPRRVTNLYQQSSVNRLTATMAYKGSTPQAGSELNIAAPWVRVVNEPNHGSFLFKREGNSLAVNATKPTINETRPGLRVTGTADVGETVDLFVNGEATARGTTTATNGTYIITLAADKGVKCDDNLVVTSTPTGGTAVPSESAIVLCGFDPTKPQLVGLAPFGIVMSQQAESFSQADPFGGFIVGYMSRQAVKADCRQVADPGRKGRLVECVEHGRPFKNADSFYKGETRQTIARIPNLNIRFQGLFQSTARTAEAPPEMTAGNPSSVGIQAENPSDTSFIASRKSFDIEMHLWYEMPFRRSPILWWGPYAAIGGSTVLSKNELLGEAVKKDGTTLDTNQTKANNDIDKYYEGGLIFNYYNNNPEDTSLYIQAILAYGNYESLADLRPQANTKHRFIGKLRVFPQGLGRGFFDHGVAAPMFGVDLNAGKGEDHLKFFVGVAFNVSKLITKLKANNPTE